MTRGRMKKPPLALILTLFLAVLVLLGLASACVGGVPTGFSEVMESLFSGRETGNSLIIRAIRIPRVLGAALCGAMLGLCGVIFQAVFRNPMADPYLLGVSGGSSLAVALGSLAGITMGFLPSIPLLAFLGGLLATSIVLAISRNNRRTLILSGIALSGLFSALTTLVIYLRRTELANIIFWNMGSFASMTMTKVSIMAAVFCLSFIFVCFRSRSLDLMLLDSQSAASLGLDIRRSRLVFLVVGTVCTASAVCFCGIIGFSGLLAPHIARLAVGPEHRRLVPSSALTGAIIMLAADTIARTIMAPTELPVGVITAILGTPLFVMLALKKENGLW